MLNNKAAKETSLLTVGIAFIMIGLGIIQQSLDPINAPQILVGVVVAAVGIVIVYIWRTMGPAMDPAVQGFVAFLKDNKGNIQVFLNYLQAQIETNGGDKPDK